MQSYHRIGPPRSMTRSKLCRGVPTPTEVWNRLVFGSFPMGRIKGRVLGLLCDCEKQENERRAIVRREI